MKIIADLHIHSKYSRATSKDLDLENLTLWGKRKGITVIGTGDFTHPAWLKELKEKLQPAEEGLFRLKPELEKELSLQIHPSIRDLPVRFMLTVEISSIYKKNGKVRKIHNVITAPGFDEVDKIRQKLEKIGNLSADGRPILGLDSRDLLEIILDVSPQCHLIPAHIWTPWFSLFGSRSGFDTIEECFQDLTDHIFALETGLSSDPGMNWRLSPLDRFTMVSNSDAHSPSKLGREANLLDTELSYYHIFEAIRSRSPQKFLGTIEFFPEEGKYHFDGHRTCKLRLSPKETLALGGICPKCKNPLTIGVMHRIEELADRPEGFIPPGAPPYQRLVTLDNVISQILGVSPNAKSVKKHLVKLIQKFGSELSILRELPPEELKKYTELPLLPEAIKRVRDEKLTVLPGYDGEYGKVQIFSEQERTLLTQPMLFSPPKKKIEPIKNSPPKKPDKTSKKKIPINPSAQKNNPKDNKTKDHTKTKSPIDTSPQIENLPLIKTNSDETDKKPIEQKKPNGPNLYKELNPRQLLAVQTRGIALISAGPGTGKTKTLTYRIASLIANREFDPKQILALTFTNKAALEMTQRIKALLPIETLPTISTFHSFCLQLWEEWRLPYKIIGDFQRENILQLALQRHGIKVNRREINKLLQQISFLKQKPNLPNHLQIIQLTDNNEKTEDERDASIQKPKSTENRPENTHKKTDKKRNTPHNSTTTHKKIEIQTAYNLYQKQLKKWNCRDLDDIISETILTLHKEPKKLQALRERYRAISVDEFQDINSAQLELLLLLVGPDTDFFAIGDPDQAIYSFRGADHRFFLNFKEIFSQKNRNITEIHLQKNYRSPQNILDAAVEIISNSPEKNRTSTLIANSTEIGELSFTQYPTEKAEAEGIVAKIEKLIGGTSYFSLDSGRSQGNKSQLSFSDIAVLYRSKEQLPPLLEALKRSGIPFQLSQSTHWWEEPKARFILGALSLSEWKTIEPISLFSLLTYLFPSKKLHNIENISKTLLSKKPLNLHSAPDVLNQNRTTLETTLGENGYRDIQRLFQILIKVSYQNNPAEKFKSLLSELRNNKLMKEFPDELAKLFIQSLEIVKNWDEFYSEICLQRGDRAIPWPTEKISLFTLHASKGLEFEVVFIPGCEEGIIPNYRAESSPTPKELAEEYRLFYVGITRSRKKLFLSGAKRRLQYGKVIKNPPSRFIDHIKQLLQSSVHTIKQREKNKRKKDKQIKLFDI